MKPTFQKTTVGKQAKFLDQARADIRGRHTSRRTEEAYIQWLKRFTPSHNKWHPIEVAEKAIDELLQHLAARDKAAASMQNSLCEIKL